MRNTERRRGQNVRVKQNLKPSMIKTNNKVSVFQERFLGCIKKWHILRQNIPTQFDFIPQSRSRFRKMITPIKYDVIYRKREGHANHSR